MRYFKKRATWFAKLLLLLLSFCFVGTAHAQNVDGTQPFSAESNFPYGSINESNLNQRFTFPVRSKPGLMSFRAYLQMNNSVSLGVSVNTGMLIKSSGIGRLLFNYTQHHPCPSLPPDPPTYTQWWRNFRYIDETGATHWFPLAGVDSLNCLDNGTWTDDNTTDSSGLTLNLTLNGDGTLGGTKVTHQDGSVDDGGGLVLQDKNGNAITNSGISFFDPTSATVPALTWHYGAHTPADPDSYSYYDAGGTQRYVYVNYSAYTQQTNWCANRDIAAHSINLPSSVSYPDGTSVGLSYEHAPDTPTGYVTGRIGALTLTTGGTVSFAYSGGANGGINGMDCSTGLSPTVSRTMNGQTTTYTHTNTVGTSFNQTIVTMPDGGTTTLSFYNTTLLSRITKTSAGATVATEITCYENAGGTPCAPSGRTPLFPVAVMDVYRYLGNTTVSTGSSRTLTALDDSYGGIPLSVTTYIPASNSTAYTTETLAYGSYGAACVGGGLSISTVCTDTVVNGSGGTVSAVRNVYDSRHNKLSNSTQVNTTTWLTASQTYSSTNGAVTSSTDVFGTLTTNSVTSCNSTLPTSTTTGSLVTTNSWDCNGGVLSSQTRPTGSVSFVHGDPLYRLTSTTDESGAVSNTYYTANSTEVTDANGGDTISTQDAYGNTKSTQSKNAAGSYDTVSHTYNGSRLASESLPCITSSPGATCPTTKFSNSYDSIGRLTQKTDSTTSATTVFTVNTNDLLKTSSGGASPTRSIQKEMDALGRLTSVCEITSLTGHASCGQTFPADGFATTYSYNPSGTLSSIAQFSNGTPRSRSFTYDFLGRTLTASTPESGVETSVYDNAPAACGSTVALGKLVQTIDAKGSTTCYYYDSLGRLASVVYSGTGSTGINKYFVYDSATVNNVAMTNAAGRMAEGYTAASVNGTKITDIGYSYSLRGEITDVYQFSTNSGGYYHTAATFFANGAVSTLTGVPTGPTWTYGLNSVGQFNTLVKSSGTPKTLVSSASYGAFGLAGITYGSGDSDTYNFSSTTGMASSSVLTQGTKSITEAFTWYPTGALQQQQFTDTVVAANSQTCAYSYDSLARVTGSNCGTNWNQTFTYDQFGNITKAATVGTVFSATYNNKNQIATLGSTTPTYDLSGDLLTINTGTLHTYTWDAAGRIASIDGKVNTYDAFDRVIEAGANLQILYSPVGKLAVMNQQTPVRTSLGLPGGNEVVYNGAITNANIVNQHADMLGSAILGTNNGQAKVFDRRFAPFGEMYNNWNNATDTARFTGKAQDLDANLYDFQYREQSFVQGRWLNPDPSGLASARLTDPQTLNLYSYVRNSSMSMTDDFGLFGRGEYYSMFSAYGGPAGSGEHAGAVPDWYAEIMPTFVWQTAAKATPTTAQNKPKPKPKQKPQMVATSHVVLKNSQIAKNQTLTTDTFGVGYKNAKGKVTPAPSDEKHTINMVETYEPGHEGSASICSPSCQWSVGGDAKRPFDSMYVTQGNDFILDKRFTIDNQKVQVYDIDTGQGGDYIRQVGANGTTTLTYEEDQ